MGHMDTVEIKAFVPSRNLDESKRFYLDLGSASPGRLTTWPISMPATAVFCSNDSMLKTMKIGLGVFATSH
jgi:hypothetical protein